MRVIDICFTTFTFLFANFAMIGQIHANMPSHTPMHSIPNTSKASRESQKQFNNSEKELQAPLLKHPLSSATARNLFSTKPIKNSNKYKSLFVVNGGGIGNSSDVVERTLATIGMFSFLVLLIRVFGDNGIIALILAAQLGMYKEVTSVIKSHQDQVLASTIDTKQQWQKWLWFLTAQLGLSGSVLFTRGIFPRGLTTNISKTLLDFVTFCFGSLSLMLIVIGMSTNSITGPEAFRSYLGEVSSSIISLLFTTGLSTFMIRTLKDYGSEWIIFSALLVITNDIMAYVFGRLFGKSKLLPKLSPKKTWEGFIGAGFSTMLIAIPILRFIVSQGTLYSDGVSHMTQHAIVLALYASIVAPFGGFLASAVKRAHYAKDFGSLIPGHGGVVDRVDCQLIMAPFVYVYLSNYF